MVLKATNATHKKDAIMAQKNQPESSEADVQEAIKTILLDKRSYVTSLNYAVEYCRAAQRMSGHALKVQILYILNNITGWRAPEAKQVRLVLRAFKGGE